MKPGKALLIILSIVVVLLVLAWIINMSNKKKAAAAAGSPTPANPAILGRYVANAASLTSDYTAIDKATGKAIWLWSGSRSACGSGYIKVLDGPDAGWCVLSESANRSKPVWNPPIGKQWCPINSNIPVEGWKLCPIKSSEL